MYNIFVFHHLSIKFVLVNKIVCRADTILSKSDLDFKTNTPMHIRVAKADNFGHMWNHKHPTYLHIVSRLSKDNHSFPNCIYNSKNKLKPKIKQHAKSLNIELIFNKLLLKSTRKDSILSWSSPKISYASYTSHTDILTKCLSHFEMNSKLKKVKLYTNWLAITLFK